MCLARVVFSKPTDNSGTYMVPTLSWVFVNKPPSDS